ncbi:MAG: hypothetical protein IPN17_30625 [Deltaproteobacteria bacterium]|nr:hypothetical protein [Deltaproteobacteria bacterium]MBK8696504.1 hypothetical protein [Deltaproteobacteria bacterium]MBP6829220.1 hypothetical protein [Deltaproteobacteria bacterium]
MSHPSTPTHEELEERLRRIEDLARRVVRVCDGYEALLIQTRLQNIAMADVLQQQVVEHTELRRQIANTTPLSALAALREAPGWQSTVPTAADVSAHGRSFPYGPHEGTEDDYCAGLWALRDEGGVSLVDICVQVFPEGDEVMVRPVGAACVADIEEVIESTITGATELAWLRLTADGRPVVR